MEIQKQIIILIAFFLTINFVYADSGSIPLIPDHFKGNLIIDNNNAPIGTGIKVYINDELKDTIFTTIVGKYDLYVKTGNYNDEIKFKINNLETSTYLRTGGKTFNENLQVWTDRDNDGINDNTDKLIGDKGDITNNFNNLSISVNDDENLNVIFTGIKNVKFKDGNKEIVNFEFDFDENVLNLFNLEIKKQSNDEGSIIVKGIPSGIIKTIYIDKLKTDTNAVCIKDEEISSITEISANCDNISETKLNCPGINGNYTCSVEGTRFKISGLSHSGVKEFYIAPPAEGGSSGGSSGGGGGGGSSGGSSSATTNNIITTPEPENINTSNETSINNDEDIGPSGITGVAIRDFVKSKKGIGVIIIGIIGALVIFRTRRLIINKVL